MIGILALAIAIILIYAGIRNYSIKDLLTGTLTQNPGGGANSTTNIASSSGVSSTTGLASPLSPTAQFARVDQGVDFSQSTPYMSLGTGTVEKISTGWSGGTGQAVYVKLNNPVMVNGRQYSEFYIAEVEPLVRVGQRIQAGQQIAKGGAAELGFLINGQPTPLQGGLGKGTKATQAGQDFLDLVYSLTNFGRSH